MARQLRNDPHGGWHHVMNRGVNRMDLFRDDLDRRWFMRLLIEATRYTSVDLVAYCLVGNHFHLLLHCPTGGLSGAMWKLGAEYARVFNRRHSRDGPVFRGRFTSKIVESDDYLISLLRYIHRNPLDLDKKPDEWPWSSYRAYVGLTVNPAWLRTDETLRIVGGQSAHRVHVAEALPSDRHQLGETDPAMLHDAWRRERIRPTVDTIAEMVSRWSGPLSPKQHSAVTLVVALDAVEWRAADLANQLGVATESAVRTRASRARARVKADDELARTVGRVSEALRRAA